MTAAEHGTLFRKMGSPISYLSIYHVNIKQSVNTCTESAQIGLHTAYCMGTSKYDAITLRDIFTPPPLLSYCVIIRRTSGWW